MGSRTFLNSVGPAYFATLGIRVVAGREFDARDREGSPEVAIVSEAFARAYFPGETALGKRVRRSEREAFAEIVGIVADSKHGSIAEAPTPSVLRGVHPASAMSPRSSDRWSFTFGPSGSPAALLSDVRRVISSIEPGAFVDVRTLRDATGAEAGLRRLGMRLFGILGLVALLLATIGLYGVMAFVVSSRTREIGTRVALGAASGDILRGVLVQGLRLVAAGIAIGALVSWLLARALVAGLAGLSPADPVAFGERVVDSPAGRACRVLFPRAARGVTEPVEALRVE